MNNHTPNNPPKQLQLIPNETALDKLDSRVRSVIIDNDLFVSVIDVLQYHGNKKNPRQSWQTTIAYMKEKQGYSNSPDIGQYQFLGSDGKRKAATPVMNFQGFMRFVQAVDVPEWENIRDWMAKLSSDSAKSKALQKQERELEKYQKAGLGSRPEILLLEGRIENKKELAELKKLIYQVVKDPNMGIIHNIEYKALFGMIADELKHLLSSESIRDSLGLSALNTLTFGEKQLRLALSVQKDLTHERVADIIRVVITPLGAYLRGYSDMMGIHPITGKPLLESGNQ